MTRDLVLDALFAELAADSEEDAQRRVQEALRELEFSFAVDRTFRIAGSSRFGVELIPSEPDSIGVAESWRMAHVMAGALESHVEPLFGDRFTESETTPSDLGLESSFDSSTAAPDDPRWSVEAIGATKAWGLEGTHPGSLGTGVLIAHPDTGYTTHPELGSQVDTGRARSFLDGETTAVDPMDRGFMRNPGHGTATGSVIVSGHGGDMWGVAPEATLVPLRVTRSVVIIGWQRRLAHAIDHAVEQGCHVISMSLGGLPARRLRHAIQNALDHGLVVIAAGGNEVQFVTYPAAYDEVIAVAACGPGFVAWSGSSKGSAIDLTAPGHLVSVARFNGSQPIVGPGSGTSFATACTAGAAALWLSYHGVGTLRARFPGAHLQRAFATALSLTCRPGVVTTWPPEMFGAGVLDVAALLDLDLAKLEAVLRAESWRERFTESALDPLGHPLLVDAHTAGAPLHELFVGRLAHRAEWERDGLVGELLHHAIADAAFRDGLIQQSRLRPGLEAAGLQHPPVPAQASLVLRNEIELAAATVARKGTFMSEDTVAARHRQAAHAAAKRYGDPRAEPSVPELPARVDMDDALRRLRMLDIPDLTPEGVTPDAERSGLWLERIIGANDLITVRFLHDGARAADAVGRVRVGPGNGGYGTGFMLTPELMMTNHHVLPRKSVAAASTLEMGYDEPGAPLVSFRLDPDRFFLADPILDYALVAVRPTGSGQRSLSEFGVVQVSRQRGAVRKDLLCNIIQHPRGEAKQIAFRTNRVKKVTETFVHYLTDTQRGSSGSPVFNDDWIVIALHHSGVPRLNDAGQMLTKHGAVYDSTIHSDDDIDWIANEGILIEAILDDLQRKAPDTELARRLLGPLLQPRDGTGPTADVPPSATPSIPLKQPGGDATGGPEVTVGAGAEGEVSVEVPLTIRITVGTPKIK